MGFYNALGSYQCFYEKREKRRETYVLENIVVQFGWIGVDQVLKILKLFQSSYGKSMRACIVVLAEVKSVGFSN